MAKDEIVTESGRVFRPGNKELLESIPSGLIQEMAKKRMDEINHHKAAGPRANAQVYVK